MMKIYYYDGHYPENHYEPGELEKQLEELKKESEALTDWPKID